MYKSTKRMLRGCRLVVFAVDRRTFCLLYCASFIVRLVLIFI